MRFAREAPPFVIPPVVLSAVCILLHQELAAVLLIGLAIFMLYFFRDPKRQFEGPPELVLAPADGTILKIDKVFDSALAEISQSEAKVLRIVTFLSVFNVHLQRCPTEGVVVVGVRKSGKTVAAFRDDAGQVNEGYLTVLQRAEGDFIGVRQIVGLIARRIVPYLQTGQAMQRGEHLGLIRFGSRVDLFLPASYEVLVKVGDKLQAGSTPVAMQTDPSSNPLA